MGSPANCKCENAHNPTIQRNEQAYLSINELNQQMEVYALENKLMMYPLQVRQAIQSLFILKQRHICDLLVSFLKAKKVQEKNQLMSDLEKIDLEEFDNILYQMKIEEQSTQTGQPYYCIGLDQYEGEGEKCVEQENVLLFATLNCFGSENCLQQTNLSSRKCPFQIFLQKVQALNSLTCHHPKVIIISNQPAQKLQPFAKIIAQLNIIIVSYDSQFPCFDSAGKIASFGNRIIFPSKSGDLIGFVQHCQKIKEVLQTVDYVCFCDVNNLIGPIIDLSMLGWLIGEKKYHILLQAYPCVNKPVIKGKFIEIDHRKIGQCLMKKQFLKSINSTLSPTFIQRMKRQKMEHYNNFYYFDRSLNKILYADVTALVQLKQFSNEVLSYSRYCQDQLGIENGDDEDIIEICPQVLYGGKDKISKIRSLLEEQQFGFPLIILKNSQDEI